MQAKELIKVKPHSYFIERFHKKLVEPISSLWWLQIQVNSGYLQTFKQVVNKLSKNKSSPLPLFFGSIDNMDPISKNKQLLRGVFKTFDTRGFKSDKIDGCQLYSACLALSKGSYETYLKTIVDIFGFQNTGRITRNEFFFFLDSFYRSLPKILISKQKGETNVRLDFKDINKFLQLLFEDEKHEIERNQIYQAMMKVPDLNQFLKYIQKRCMASAQSSRNAAIQRIKIQSVVRECLIDMIIDIQRRLEKG